MIHPVLFEEHFRTARPVYCHQEFLDKLAERRNEPVGKRAGLILQVAVDISRLHYKPTNGVNRGWGRSRLGGRSGSHFYAWWAPANDDPGLEQSDAAHSDATYVAILRERVNFLASAPQPEHEWLLLALNP